MAEASSDPPTFSYPFRPKSVRWLLPGQFWAVPLADGRFACGRVLVVGASFAPRVGFVAGLLDWVGNEPPSSDDIAGAAVLASGSAHIKAITETGGEILGCRPLTADGIETPDQEPDSTWGFHFIVGLAEREFAA